MAYEFAVALNINHKFNNEKKIAGYDWLWSFLRRHPELSIRKAEGLSMARGRGLTREAANHFYNLLETEINLRNLQDKPQSIFNVDESGIQLINKVGKVVAKKGAKVVNKITTGEKGETVSLVACCSAEGRFLPPSLIYKGKNLKPEFQDGLPTGSKVFMNQKSAYINSDLFLQWFKELFLPRKAPGRNILVLDGHCSHVTSIALLELAEAEEVTLLCLPPHTTHALQPLDKSFFGPLKAYFKTASNTWVEQHVGRRLTRYQVGPLVCEAWEKSASVGNGTSGFKSTGIFPLDKNVLPDYLFSISDNMVPNSNGELIQNQPNSTACASNILIDNEPQPCCSKDSSGPEPEGTPSKHLAQISPVPKLNEINRKKKGAVVLTSKENREQLKRRLDEKTNKDLKKRIAGQRSKSQLKKTKLNFETDASVSGDSDVDEPTIKSKNASLDTCVECGELYQETQKTCDWLSCATCKLWLHEDCTIFDAFCVDCGRKNRQKSK